jgi:Ca-activated chloride channel homolog
MRRSLVILLVGALVTGTASCGGEGDDAVSGDTGIDGDPGDCTVVDMAVSSEKIALLTELANEFNDGEGSDAEGGCVFVRPRRVASGGAAQLIVDGWPNPDAARDRDAETDG